MLESERSGSAADVIVLDCTLVTVLTDQVPMILWTIQREPAVRQMERTGFLRGDGRRIWRHHRYAYQWMIRQMNERLGPPPRGSRYPVWAWKIFNPSSPRPDLRRTAQLPKGMRGARIEIAVPEDRVLLSDFERWEVVLACVYLADSKAEDEEMERQQVWRDFERVEKSWSRIFELDGGDPAWHDEPDERSIQATLWYVRLSEVRSMTWFTAR